MAVGGGSSGSLRDVLLGGRGGSSGGCGHGGGSSSRGGTSQGGTAAGGILTWRSLRSVSGTAVDPRGHFFPAKLARFLGFLKLFIAVLMVALGVVALVLQAALSPLGAGLWAGAVVGLSGFLGVCASLRPYAHVYVVSFMCVSILSMASSGLLIILSATAWARDNQHPTAVFVEQATQEEVRVLGEVLVRKPSVLVSGALVLLGVLDCMLSLACITLSAREACGFHSKGEHQAQGLSEGHNRKERLYRWLGQQKTIFPIGSAHTPPRGISSVSQFVPLSSSESASTATPRKTLTDPSAASSLPSSSSHRLHPHHQVITGSRTNAASTPSHLSSLRKMSSNGSRLAPPSSMSSVIKASSLSALHNSHSLPRPSSANQQTVPTKHRHSTSGRVPHSHTLPHVHPIHPQDHSGSVQHPHHHHPHHAPHSYTNHNHLLHHTHQQHFPSPHAAHPSLYYPNLVTPMLPIYPTEQIKKQKQMKKESKKHKDKDNKKDKKKSKKKELTDEQIDRTYTGLDREIAEEFIDTTMEPGISIQRAFHNTFEQESF